MNSEFNNMNNQNGDQINMQSNNNKSNKGLIIGLSVAGVIILIIVGMFAWNKYVDYMYQKADDEIKDSIDDIDDLDDIINNNKQDDDSNNDKSDSLDISKHCEELGCTYITSDSDLKEYNKLNTLDKAEVYSDEVALNVNIGVYPKEFKNNEASAYDLFAMMAKYLGYNSCFEKNYAKDKIYELYNVNINTSINFTTYSGNYYCDTQGGGGSPYALENKDYKTDSNNHIWTYLYRSQEDGSTKTIITKFIYTDGLFKLVEIESK